MSDEETVRAKDLKVFELTPGLADALSAALDSSYTEYFKASLTGRSTKEAEKRIGTIPEDKRYLTRMLDSLDNAFADFDTALVVLDLPHMEKHKPEAINVYLQFRLQQYRILLGVVESYISKK